MSPLRRPLPIDAAHARAARDGILRSARTAARTLGRALQDRRMGPHGSIARHERLDVVRSFPLTSPAFDDGGRIPDRAARARSED